MEQFRVSLNYGDVIMALTEYAAKRGRVVPPGETYVIGLHGPMPGDDVVLTLVINHKPAAMESVATPQTA
jgi:hypothetical protein